MGSYVLHAWRDAMAIASLLDQEIGIAKARKIYEGLNRDGVIYYESEAEASIGDFIQKTESQRLSFVKKLPASETTRVVFLTLAIIGCVRAKTILELRDNYRNSLAPGGGNRVTVADIYRFGQEVASAVSYDWPWEPVDAMGHHDDYDDLSEENVE